MKYYLSFLLLLIFFMFGCTGKNESILSTPVQKDPGSLAILNTSGFLGATVAGSSLDHVLTIKANGGLTLSNINVTITTNDPISFKDGSYPGTGGRCGTILNSGDTCTIVLSYQPVDTDSHLATLNFTYRDALKSYQKNYQVSADSHPILSFEYGTLYDFGNKFVGSSTDLRIRISNTGRVVAENINVNNLGLPFSMKGGSYPGAGGTCSSSLSPGETCDMYVNYSPTGNGEHLQNITLTYLNTGRVETNTLRLMAWGFYQAQLTVSDSSGYNFGTVASGISHDKIFTITHSGGDVSASSLNVLNLSSPFNYKGGNFPGTGGTCTRTLTKETGSCTVVISLSTASSGTWNNTIAFSYFNGTNTITLNRPLSAITRQKALVSFSPSGTHNFGVISLNSSVPQIFTVTYLSGELPASNFGFTPLSGFFTYTGGSYPGTSGTCGTSLSSGSCTISLSYAPTSNGIHTLNTNFTYSDAATTLITPLTLQGKTEGKITNTSGAFGNVVNGMSKDITVTISSSAGNNITGLTLSSISSPYSFKGGTFPGSGGTCSGTLNASSSCTIILTFSPVVEGTQNGTLTLLYNGGINTQSLNIPLTGTSTPAANITISSTNFGSTSVNSAKEMAVTITNSSTISPSSATWNFPTGFGFKNGSFPGTGGNCWASSCTVVLVFTPTVAATYSGTLSLNYNDGTGNIKTATATLAGTGTPTDDLFLSRFDTVSFSSLYVGNTFDVSFILSHGGGTTPALITSKTLANTTDYSIINDTCPASLNNGASCTFTVRFTPQSAGTKASSFSVNFDNGVSKTVTRLITGSGVNPALLTPSPVSLSFGSRATDATYDLNLTISHSGSANATSFTRTITGAGFTKVADTCSTTLGSNNTCNITIRFSPTTAINYSGNLAFSYYNGFKTVTTNIALTGIGEPTAVLSYSSSSYDFGKIIQTQTSTQTITVTHSGPVPATNISISTLSAPYSFKGGSYPGTGGTCTDTLSTGSCSMVIDFSPTTTGIKDQTLTLSYDNGSTTRTINALLTGESLAQAIISISETNPYNFGTTNISGSIDKTFTLSNSGSVAGTSLTGSFDLGVFTFKGGSYPGVGGNCGSTLAAGATCSIVLNFKPTNSITYNGSFTLNYHDGLRTQSEYKNLSGTGSNALNKEYYLSLLNEEYVMKRQKVYVNQSPLWGDISTEKIILYRRSGKVYFQETNHLSPLLEGITIQRLNQDINKDGTLDFLFSIHQNDSTVVGYSIRCGKTGHVLERYIRTSY